MKLPAQLVDLRIPTKLDVGYVAYMASTKEQLHDRLMATRPTETSRGQHHVHYGLNLYADMTNVPPKFEGGINSTARKVMLD